MFPLVCSSSSASRGLGWAMLESGAWDGDDCWDDSSGFGEIEYNGARVCLQCDGIAQRVSGIAMYDSTFTLNDGHILYVIDMYAEHDSLPSSKYLVNSTSRASEQRCPFCWIGAGPSGEGNFREVERANLRYSKSCTLGEGTTKAQNAILAHPGSMAGTLGKVRAAQRLPRKRALRERALRRTRNRSA